VTRDEIAARIRAGGLSLAFDTNALWNDRKFIAVSGDINRYNARLAARDAPPVRMIVCAVAHSEKLFDLKQKYQDTFDAQVIFDGLRSKGTEIQAFEAKHAMETSVRLGERFADAAAWRTAKQERCLRCVGVSVAPEARGKNGVCGATVDWLIGGHARAEGCVLVTDDTGPEFAGLADRVRLDTLVAAVQVLLAEAG
jgi:hypothetical protein